MQNKDDWADFDKALKMFEPGFVIRRDQGFQPKPEDFDVSDEQESPCAREIEGGARE